MLLMPLCILVSNFFNPMYCLFDFFQTVMKCHDSFKYETRSRYLKKTFWSVYIYYNPNQWAPDQSAWKDLWFHFLVLPWDFNDLNLFCLIYHQKKDAVQFENTKKKNTVLFSEFEQLKVVGFATYCRDPSTGLFKLDWTNLKLPDGGINSSNCFQGYYFFIWT